MVWILEKVLEDEIFWSDILVPVRFENRGRTPYQKFRGIPFPPPPGNVNLAVFMRKYMKKNDKFDRFILI